MGDSFARNGGDGGGDKGEVMVPGGELVVGRGFRDFFSFSFCYFCSFCSFWSYYCCSSSPVFPFHKPHIFHPYITDSE